ncbi:MAG: glycosyltransferase family 4 protein [Planctomycetota bacterium]|nr:glycosyltransferase family 4 protein [Planctomycetota bacterium]
MRKLRIAILSDGASLGVPPYICFLRRRGHDIHWITFTPPTKSYGAAMHDVSGSTKPLGPRWMKWRYVLYVPKIRKILREVRPDLLHAFYATSGGILSVLSGFRPYIISVLGSDLITSVNSLLWKRIVRTTLARSALVHTVSDQLADLARELGIPSDKIWVMTQGVDTELFSYQPRKELTPPIRILCIRSLREVYDPFTVVRACKILKNRGFEFALTFAARGLREQEVRALVSSLGLEPCVEFLGGYDIEDLPKLLHHHDIYLSASHWDGTSLSLLEAMAGGIFPIVSRITGNLAWVKDNDTALMFEAGDADGLADAVIRVVDNPSLRMAAVEKNRALIERRGAREENMMALEQRYYQLLG